MTRLDGRKYDELRPIKFTRNYNKFAEGSVLIEIGDTKVICNATVEEFVPPFMKNQGRGWVTAEYSMLPRATKERTKRESVNGKQDGRTVEIQRIIGRSLRGIIDMDKLGERSIKIDCDVIQADGGTRTASITGAFVALHDAVTYMLKRNMIKENPITEFCAAISVGRYNNTNCLDLCYQEDSAAQVDMNLIMTESGRFIEVQGTAEDEPFTLEDMHGLLELGKKGIGKLIEIQKQVVGQL